MSGPVGIARKVTALLSQPHCGIRAEIATAPPACRKRRLLCLFFIL